MRHLALAFLLGILMLVGTGFAQQSGKPFVTIGTGGITGVYYAAGHAIAKVFRRNAKNPPFRLDAEAGKGSVENINKVLAGDWAFGIAQADMLYKEEHGTGPWQGTPHDDLRAVAALYPEAVTLVTAADAEIRTIADLKGKTVSIGAPGSADLGNVRKILALHGIDPKTDLKLVKLPPIDASRELQKGFLDAYFYTVGHPNLSVREATFGSRKIRLIGIDPAITAAAVQKIPYLIQTRIPIGFYPALENRDPVSTLGVKAVFFTSKETPDETVAAVLQTLLDDFGRFQRQHPAFAGLTPKMLTQGVILPLHPAAERIYRKEGLLP
ncbi:C4-dicarboxylate ABC transporter substrate-binding protein [Geothermobacter hydrogeniphilus]|uniref:C4-dicarboxylate ABC transporter substrate-binding protein n=1 Tax=Geothermobacter hydrogeniphilus TaxID=1969733 RepID=A0A2K2HB06_9BACT|nr:TAXI family TRAP transporter solute-binding subunit [Geothermobacter hydrogeniphilus]PNU20451.1 C4-dicarboxylate ABC transporter substrate-binding protein [Geothermobacter hydrogeniphilus]